MAQGVFKKISGGRLSKMDKALDEAERGSKKKPAPAPAVKKPPVKKKP